MLKNQKGNTHLFVLLVVLSLISVFIITSTFSFKKSSLSTTFSIPPSSAAGPQGIQAGQPIDDAGNILITDSVAQRMADSGAGWVRVNFRLGPYSSDTTTFYSKYDTIITTLRSKGLQVIGLMSNESWRGSQADWTANNYENTGRDGHNSYIDGFGYEFARMAKHYEGKIKYWEIWNEPNCWNQNPSPGVYSGCTYIYPSNFAALLTHTHTQAHYYNSINVQIISGGLFGHDISGFSSGNAGADYLDQTYNVGINGTGKFAWTKATYGTYPLDGVGQHIYITGNRAVDQTQFSNYLDYVHNVLVKYEGPSTTKKTFVTEYGWGTNSVDDTTQANNLAAALQIMKNKSYVQTSTWFQLDDNPPANLYYGIFRSDLSKKPSYSQFQTQTTYQGRKSDGSIVSAILNYYNGHGGVAIFGSPYDNGGGPWAHYWDFGYVQDFDGGRAGRGAIFDTGHGVGHDFWVTYLQGNNHSILKFPTSEEYAYQGGTRQDFQGGYMTWTATSGVKVFPK